MNKSKASANFRSGTPSSCAFLSETSIASQSQRLAAAMIESTTTWHLSQKIILARAWLYSCGPCGNSHPSWEPRPALRTLSMVSWTSAEASNTKQFFKSRIRSFCSFRVFALFSISMTARDWTPLTCARARVCWIATRSVLSLSSSRLRSMSAFTMSSLECAARMLSRCFFAFSKAAGPSGNIHAVASLKPWSAASFTQRSTSGTWSYTMQFRNWRKTRISTSSFPARARSSSTSVLCTL
mmetsp:Transcript_651/g.2201  ORF Transcript_651/g.2201 Transcript_651/m.2201 type:complete len:240 (+) Transcript_651:1097-1816(+)